MKTNENEFTLDGVEYEAVAEIRECQGCIFDTIDSFVSRGCSSVPTCDNVIYKVKDNAYAQLEAKYKEAQSLLDACYEVVELWDCQAPSQIEWKRGWLEGARKHGVKTF